MASPVPASTRIRFDLFELDVTSGELRKAGILLKLQPQPFRVLLLLIERAGQVVTREEIQRCLWTDSTFVDFEHGINFSINQIRGALVDSAENPRYVETIPRRGYRFIGAVEQPPAGSITVPERASGELPKKVAPRRWPAIVSLMAMVVAISAAGTYVRFHRTPVLTEKDTVVLTDFMNTTGDAVFDGTLRQGLEMQLEQSPFLSLISESRVQQMLRLMGKPADAQLTPGIARDLCQRTGSKAYIVGSIANLGNDYVIGLNAVNCATGDSLASEQMQAVGKEKVLDAIGRGAAKLRAKLGESLSTVQSYDTPIEQVTTPSLEALQAYSLARRVQTGNNPMPYYQREPFFQRAIQLDPNFAMAYASLAASYHNLGEPTLAAESMRKAYELRERVSEREKFYIESHYHHYATGDLIKARHTYELWEQTYPRDPGPRNNLGIVYLELGQIERAFEQARDTYHLAPNSMNYSNLIIGYLYVNRLREAQATAEEAKAKKMDSDYMRANLYLLAFLQNDAAGMAQQVAGAAGMLGFEDLLQYEEADTAAYYGRLGKAREFSRRAVALAKQADEKEAAAGYEAESALREALFGNAAEARKRAAAALGLSKGRDVQYGAALALGFAGDAARAQALGDDLAKRFPEGTVVKFNYLPAIRAQLAFIRNDLKKSSGTGQIFIEFHADSAPKAIEILQAASPYELGLPGGGAFTPALYPVYVRGQAYLAERQGGEAATEFQKILDWPGVVQTEPIGALARLGLGRAYLLQGDTARARAAYQDFLTLWKDADPDIPVLKQAKAEYAKLP